MIVSFSVSNFRSFAEEQTLSLVASNRFPDSDHGNHLVPIPGSDEKLLRIAVLYGANGAGKSNFFKALAYLRHMALLPRTKNNVTEIVPFRFAVKQSEPSSFDLRFIVEGRLYRFGFKVDSQRILEEWLVSVEGGREKEIYERITDNEGKVTIDATGIALISEKLKALATVGGPQNQTFLATIRANLQTNDYGNEISAILDWLNNDLQLIAPETPFLPLGQKLARDKIFLNFASDFLKSSATGVDRLQVIKKEISEEQLRSLLPEQFISDMLKDTQQKGKTVYLPENHMEILIEKTQEKHYFLVTIQAAHEHVPGSKVSLELTDESDGTRRLLNLIPALHRMNTQKGIFVIDEIDRSMHPLLTWKYLEYFLSVCSAGNRQIIVTTHESNLLDLDLLRRDEIWFAEKNKSGATHLYSLSDFKVRTDLSIQKHYLQGRFGAIPFLGDIDRLKTAEEKTE